MSWLFSQALAGEYLEGISLDGAQSALWNVTPTQPLSWLQGKTMGACRLSRSGMTFAPLTDDHGKVVLMSFLEDFPAKTYRQQGTEQVLMDTDLGYGWNRRESFAKYSHLSHTWKIRPYSQGEDCTEFSGTWPRWGLMQGGECWGQDNSGQITTEKGSGLLPTICASEHRDSAKPIALSKSDKGGRVARRICSRYWKDQQRTQESVSLSPSFAEWMMGWPIGWTELSALETGRFQEWRQARLDALSDGIVFGESA